MHHDPTHRDDSVDALLDTLSAELDGADPPGARELSAHTIQAARLVTPTWPLLVAACCSASSLLAMYTQLRSVEEQLLVFLP